MKNDLQFFLGLLCFVLVGLIMYRSGEHWGHAAGYEQGYYDGVQVADDHKKLRLIFPYNVSGVGVDEVDIRDVLYSEYVVK